jgi:hypothetical protein
MLLSVLETFAGLSITALESMIEPIDVLERRTARAFHGLVESEGIPVWADL